MTNTLNDHIIETYLLISTCKRSDAKNIVCPCYHMASR